MDILAYMEHCQQAHVHIYLLYTFLKRSTASRMFSLWPKAEARTNPSPAAPNPLPGVVTISHFSRISANTSQESLPGNPTHTYGALSPPNTVNPMSSKVLRRILAFSL
mmetsp:Transcript_13634/g.27228  ORF Transcript_13634/g.27228 Transcript_13634/m.27228 type:complete len:108 (-) Transcript_13634:1149-1472(-)